MRIVILVHTFFLRKLSASNISLLLLGINGKDSADDEGASALIASTSTLLLSIYKILNITREINEWLLFAIVVCIKY